MKNRVTKLGKCPSFFMMAFAILWAPSCYTLDQDGAAREYSYHEGFEGTAPKVLLWAANGASVDNYIGPSEECAFEGKRSLKLDVTLKGGNYHYWGVQVRVPCAGQIKISARVKVAEGTTAQVGFGTNVVFPPTQLSACGACVSFQGPTGGWKLAECSLAERGKDGAAFVVGNNSATLHGDEVGSYLDRWVIFVWGGEGKRAIVYIDDIRIEGQGPTEAEYEAETRRRWAAGQERFQIRVRAWRERLAAAGAFGEMVDPPLPARPFNTIIKERAAGVKSLLDKLAQRGYASDQEIAEVETAIEIVRYAPDTINALSAAKKRKSQFLVFAPRAITNTRISTDLFPIPAPVAHELSCAGCRGEYRSVSAAVYALRDLENLRVSATDLKGSAGTIDANAVDIYVVKCWYQAGRGVSDTTHKCYVPELLLKDDDLVRVDTSEQQNYLRSTAIDGTETYLLCSGQTSEDLKEVRPLDAATLQPVDIAANSLKQFWFRIHIPENAKPGRYEGKVELSTAHGRRKIPLKVMVYPFELLKSPLLYSIYYMAQIAMDGKPTITSASKSEEQYRAEMMDLKAHGVLYPTNYVGMDEPRLRRVLEIRKEVGLPGGPFFNLGYGTGSSSDPRVLDTLRVRVKQWIDFVRPFGYDQVFVYGLDEATDERLISQKDAWKAVQEAGGKTFVACYAGTFEAMGKLLNCAVVAGKPNLAEAKKWHSVGSLAFCYAYPQAGCEEPETYRRHFGLELWKAGFDGCMDFAYQCGMGHIWNDFDSTRYRDLNFTYPTVNGIVGTIQWEGFREAVDDERYVTTLEDTITNAPASRRALAARARAWLEAVDVEAADLDKTRATIAGWIGQLQ